MEGLVDVCATSAMQENHRNTRGAIRRMLVLFATGGIPIAAFRLPFEPLIVNGFPHKRQYASLRLLAPLPAMQYAACQCETAFIPSSGSYFSPTACSCYALCLRLPSFFRAGSTQRVRDGCAWASCLAQPCWR